MMLYDCAVANLPWGQNTLVHCQEENKNILDNLRDNLHHGAYCAFITKDDSLESVMEELGFYILEKAHVPQKNFDLPSSKKKKKKQRSNSGFENEIHGSTGTSTSDCVITFVQYL